MASTTTDADADAAADAAQAATLLQLIWLASPALPVGGFSYSEGLEAAVESGLVTSAKQAAQWLQDQQLLGQLAGLVPAAVDEAIARDDGTRFAFTPMLAISSAQHETQYSRLFRS